MFGILSVCFLTVIVGSNYEGQCKISGINGSGLCAGLNIVESNCAKKKFA